ncbi:tRNA 5'-guanylyltransferase [Crossiella sp. SN42]|uniref:tRNA(His) guanylyltransferase Thg1 family protein n=1 Tax=Crossiella sp. SN42 TaxID=2944808 RepID=UPI00207D3B2E|nr:tRNA(His) guanylyltransferase Thg1 family protein [Crossiella sp. SN42]MCO1574691.1 tRNA 5'-guanylyltransferase [Crossiella sp. SN42]
MNSAEFEAAQRAREWFQGLTLLPGAWAVLRLDGRSFTRFTEQRFSKPYDERFAGFMAETARLLLTELGGRFAYTQSDEISVLLPPEFALFGRRQEKLVSISAGLASAAFTHAAGAPAHFDSRVWLGGSPAEVADYFSWRQADAARNALNAWSYWTLRGEGRSGGQATAELRGLPEAAKHELLFARGINFTALPAWQRRGIGLWWQAVPVTGFDPVRETEVTSSRRRVHVERELPVRREYRELVLAQAGSGVATGRAPTAD